MMRRAVRFALYWQARACRVGVRSLHLVGLVAAAAFLLSLGAGAAAAKERQTYYTVERIGTAKTNLTSYPWAQNQLNAITQRAAPSLALTTEKLWDIQPPTAIPRAYPNWDTIRRICPVHGKLSKDGTNGNRNEAFDVDPIGNPGKLICKLGQETYPLPGFDWGIYASPLTYADTADGWVAPAAGTVVTTTLKNNGGAFSRNVHADAASLTFYFARQYAHLVYLHVTLPLIRDLSQAYLLEDDKEKKEAYGLRGAVLLARLAQVYPAEEWFRFNPPGTSIFSTGMITDRIWECEALEKTALAYDALYGYMKNAQASSELITFLSGRGVSVNGQLVASGADVCTFIEENLLRVGMQALKDGNIKGNDFHQAAAAACALVMDDWDPKHDPNSNDMLVYLYHGRGHLNYFFENSAWPDGGLTESPSYNAGRAQSIFRAVKLIGELRKISLEQFDDFPDVLTQKARAVFDHFIDLTVQNYFTPGSGDIGDSGGRADPPRYWAPLRASKLDVSSNLFAYEKFPDAKYAAACLDLQKTPPEFPGGNLFEAYPIGNLAPSVVGGAIPRRSRLLDSYGVGILESASNPPLSVALNYAALRGHWQIEPLNLQMVFDQVPLVTDLGYPSAAPASPLANQFDRHIMAQNTVAVDASPARGPNNLTGEIVSFLNAINGGGSFARLFAEAQGVHVFVAQQDPYLGSCTSTTHIPQGVDIYLRMLVLVDAPPDGSYVVDLFSVRGGGCPTHTLARHEQSWHGMFVPPTASFAVMPPQAGTLAGPDVPYNQSTTATWIDEWGRRRDDFPSFVTEIETVTISVPVWWEWITQPQNAATEYGLRLHVIPVLPPGECIELIQGAARSPAWTANSTSLPQIIVRRSGDYDPNAPLTSRFLSVLEPFKGRTPYIQYVALTARSIDSSELELTVVRNGGDDVITLGVPPWGASAGGHLPLGVRVVTSGTNGTGRTVTIGSLGGSPSPQYAIGTISVVDYVGRKIGVSVLPERASYFAPGRAVRIFSPGRSSVYRIEAVEAPEGPSNPSLMTSILLTLRETALLGRAKVIAVEQKQIMVDGQTATGPALKLDAALVFASDDSRLSSARRSEHKGAWLVGEEKPGLIEPGIPPVKLRGSTYDGTIYGDPPSGAQAATSRVYPDLSVQEATTLYPVGQLVSFWDYGIDDEIEAVGVETLQCPGSRRGNGCGGFAAFPVGGAPADSFLVSAMDHQGRNIVLHYGYDYYVDGGTVYLWDGLRRGSVIGSERESEREGPLFAPKPLQETPQREVRRLPLEGPLLQAMRRIYTVKVLDESGNPRCSFTFEVPHVAFCGPGEMVEVFLGQTRPTEQAFVEHKLSIASQETAGEVLIPDRASGQTAPDGRVANVERVKGGFHLTANVERDAPVRAVLLDPLPPSSRAKGK